jgi:ubiquinone/menaquinone biosynthesis C-methylase UbiE
MVKLFHPESNKELNYDPITKGYSVDDYKFNNFESIPDLFISDKDLITINQSAFYNDTQFPSYDDLDDFASLIDKASKSIFAKKLDQEIPFGSNILEAGCGTGQMSIFLSRFMRTIYSIDISKGSLIAANNFIKKNNLKNINLFRMNIFKLFFQKNFFDVIISNGVLHHTRDAELAFGELVKYLKKDGLIIIGLYHKYGRFIHNIRQKVISIFGEKFKFIDPRFKENISINKKKSWFLDQYKNPFEKNYTMSEVLKWFKNNKIQYISSVPFDFDVNEPLFKKRNINNKKTLLFKEFMLLFDSQQIKEAGFFVIIGKKI